MAGFIYIMSNSAFPNLIKIGKSKKDPTIDRVHELNQTGVPEPFKVEYYAFVEDEDYIERAVHEELASQRPNKSREFFSVKVHDAIRTVRDLAKQQSALKYEQINTNDVPLQILKPQQLKRALRKYGQELKSEYLKKENHLQNQALKILIPCLLIIILLGSVLG